MNFNCSLSHSVDIKSAQLLHDSRLHQQPGPGRDAFRVWGEQHWGPLADCVFISCIHTNYKHRAISSYMMESPHTGQQTRKIPSKSQAGYSPGRQLGIYNRSHKGCPSLPPYPPAFFPLLPFKCQTDCFDYIRKLSLHSLLRISTLPILHFLCSQGVT